MSYYYFTLDKNNGVSGEVIYDSNGDTLTMTATYTLGANAAVTIPGGIFTKPSSYEIAVTPTSVS